MSNPSAQLKSDDDRMASDGGTKRPSSSEDAKRPHHSQHQSSSTISTTTTANTSSSGPLSVPQAQQQGTRMRPSKDRPLMKLSIDLIETYKFINKVYYEQKAKKKLQREASAKQSDASLHGRWDDDNYDYIVKENEDFGEEGRYTLKEKIGKGSFGQVVKAYDNTENKEVAIKIIKSKKPFTLQARTEIELLEQLKSDDSNDENNIVRLINHFFFRGHQCLVFEMLSLNLYELLKNTQFRGVSLNLIRKFAKQILRALDFLSQPNVNIIHCDLKPENILLRSPRRSAIKVIDFGSSCKSDKKMYSYIQSRFYRSPEVMLGISYSVAIDIWSLGCILVEMHTGEPLFAGSEQFDQMRKLIEVLGMVPTEMIEKSPANSRNQFFDQVPGKKEYKMKANPPQSRNGKSSSRHYHQMESRSLSEIVGAETGGPRGQRLNEEGHTPTHYSVFVDLVSKMLAYDPAERIKPSEALLHPFITNGEGPAGGADDKGRRSRSAPIGTRGKAGEGGRK
ncbi:hypothetical protein TrRE_jg5612 [Triparma retinervis]|uniref:Protein kinase domain-containing protein n=1 Tax=Triparma retinervis TaxID=2557542 RepID=A0A9W7DWR0_9STRA|nr:hypothetical protein TrRE_jg5612 [Triparma retinervis]